MMGSCKACGECCKWLTFHPFLADYDMTFLKIRGGRMVKGVAFFYHPCPELNEDGKCKIFTTRPRYCHAGHETNYESLKELGCRFDDVIRDDPGVLKIHIQDVTGAAEYVR